jgi:hypothetical protein
MGDYFHIIFTTYPTLIKDFFYLPSNLTSELRMIMNALSFREGMNPQIFLFSLDSPKNLFLLR